MKSIEEYKKIHEESKKFRKDFREEYGEILTSVWEQATSGRFSVKDKVNQGKVRLEEFEKRIPEGADLKEYLKYTGIKNVEYREGNIWATSKFPKNICQRIVRFYSKPGETILDPCAGHNSRMQVCYEEGRNYIGYDVSEEYMKFNEELRKELIGESSQKVLFDRGNFIKLHKHSSEVMFEDNESIDLIFTSPPYWDTEFYGEETAQFGYGKTYEEFLAGIKRMMGECNRVLKKDKFCLININDFRKNGKFYMFHRDIANIGEEVGFKLFDIIIMKFQSSIRQNFLRTVVRDKMMPKIHEYILVFKKV